MKSSTLFRIASVLFVLFAAGHTVGFLRFRAPTPEARAVRAAMDSAVFHVRNSALSYGGFYVGFGLFITAFLAFSAVVAWHLSRLARTDRDAIGWFGWAFFALQLASVALCVTYFSLPQAVFSVATAACVGGGSWLARPTGAPAREAMKTAA